MMNFLKVILIALLFAGCDKVLSSSSSDNPIQLHLNMKAEQIQTLQDIEAELDVTNISNKVITYEFSSSCQHGFKIEKGDNILFDSQSTIGCLAVITQLELNPQESKTYEISLHGMEGSDSLDAGKYEMKAFLLNKKSPQVKTSFLVK